MGPLVLNVLSEHGYNLFCLFIGWQWAIVSFLFADCLWDGNEHRRTKRRGGDNKKKQGVWREAATKEKQIFLAFCLVWSEVVLEVFFLPAAFIEIWNVNRRCYGKLLRFDSVENKEKDLAVSWWVALPSVWISCFAVVVVAVAVGLSWSRLPLLEKFMWK